MASGEDPVKNTDGKPTFTVSGYGYHRVIIGQTKLATWIIHELERGGRLGESGTYQGYIDGRPVPLAQLEGLAALGAEDWDDNGAHHLHQWVKTAPRPGAAGYEELIAWLTEVAAEADRRAARLDPKTPEGRADPEIWVDLLTNVAEVARLALNGAVKLRDLAPE